MSRRGKGEGSIFKRANGLWVAQVPLRDGKRKYKTGRTRAIVAAWLADTQQRVKKNRIVPDEHLTVRVYLEAWLGTVKLRHNLADRTVKRYNELLRLHVIPTLGRIPLALLSVAQVRELYNQKSEKLSPVTVRCVRGALGTALQDAVADEILEKNVATLAKLAPIKRKERPILTPQEANRLLEMARGDRWEALYWLVLNTGAREDELLSLRWSDILWDQSIITIRASKTDAGVRKPGLIPQTIEKLREHKRRLVEERLQAATWKDQGPLEQALVFPNTLGGKQSAPGLLTYHFYPLLERAGLPRVHFHDLRHTTVSWLLSLGISVVDVAKYVGHANPATTFRFYAHSLPDSQQAILQALEQALSGGNSDGQAVR